MLSQSVEGERQVSNISHTLAGKVRWQVISGNSSPLHNTRCFPRVPVEEGASKVTASQRECFP